ncbi:MAG: protein kinase [Rhodothermales bacterium]
MPIPETISHYRVEAELGRGGMGVVYKAKDTKLDRTVALKVLPAHMLASEDDRARFFREARAAAALHHPNIATIFEIDEHEDQPFIAMEFIDGKSLADRIVEGPLPLTEVAAIASQIAGALKAAHEKNVVHRDIKSANVMLSSDGTAKILDFGLAKTAASTKLTQLGSTLGTIAYMSPEQARGQEVDKRTDIWSLGVVIYEMISGKLPFPGDYEQAVIYGILNEEAHPLTAIRTGVPMELEWVVNKCLAKDRDLRYQNAGEIPVDLKAIEIGRSRISTATTSVPVAASPVRKRRPGILIAGLAGLVIGLAAAWILFSMAKGPARLASVTEAPVMRLSLHLPESAPLATVGSAPLDLGQPALTIAPDGSILVYAGHARETTALYTVVLATGEVTMLRGTEGAYAPFFSPNGDWVGYFANDQLLKVRLDGSLPIAICEAADPLGGTWLSNNEIVFSNNQGSVVAHVSSDGGPAETISAGGNDFRASFPSAMPDGSVLGSNARSAQLVDIATGAVSTLPVAGTNMRYLRSGHLAYVQPGRLFVRRLDPSTRTVSETAIPAVDDLRTEVLRGAGQYTVSDEGTLIYVAGHAADLGRLVWVGRNGEEEPLPFEPDFSGTFRISPKGNKVAQVVRDGTGANLDLWILDLARQTRVRFERNVSGPGIWTPDGESILFSVEGALSGSTIIKKRAVNGGAEETVYRVDSRTIPSAVTPDGRYLISYGYVAAYRGIQLVPLQDSTASIIPVATSSAVMWGGRPSPDGRYIAYTSDESGRSEVWVTSTEGAGSKWQISTDGGEEPIWSPTSNEIFFSSTPSWYSVRYRLDPTPSFETPQLMFSGQYMQIGGFGYDVAPDGSRFLLVKQLEPEPRPTELKVVVNWFGEIRNDE